MVWLVILALAIIILTLLIKALLNPLNKKALESQKMMAEMQPKIKEIQNKFKDAEKQGRELLKLYQETKFNPFPEFFFSLSSCLFFGLFSRFSKRLKLGNDKRFNLFFCPSANNN